MLLLVLLAELADDRTDSGSQCGCGQERGREQPDHQSGRPAEDSTTGDVGTAVVLGHFYLAVRVAVHHDSADHLILAVVLSCFQRLVVVGCRPGDRVGAYYKDEISCSIHSSIWCVGAYEGASFLS